MKGAPPKVAERVARALFDRHEGFGRTEDGGWTLLQTPPTSGAPLLTALKYAVVDVETTGTGAERGHRITEVAVVPVDDGEVGEVWTTLINPERVMPPGVVALTRITHEMVRGAPRFGDVSADVVERLRGRVFVAHNATFDWRFIGAELARTRESTLVGDRLCTARLARVVLPQLKRRSLDALAGYFGLTIVPRHRAAPDAIGTAHILCRMLAVARDLGYDTWPALAARLDRRTGRARRKRTAMPHPVDYATAAS
jgi:DNA polymerase-3 subunit epsilon